MTTALMSTTSHHSTNPTLHEGDGRMPVEQVESVRVMTYNIEAGQRWPAVLELILEAGADIVCLQEVPQKGSISPGVVDPTRIVDALGWPSDFRLLWDRAPRMIGNMTLTRWPIAPGDVLHSPTSRPYGMVSHIQAGPVKLVVANVHLSPLFGPPPLAFPVTEIYRLREVTHLTKNLKGTPGLVIAAGDYNTFWPAPAAFYMSRNWRDCRARLGWGQPGTRPTYGLDMTIDHIFLRGDLVPTHYEVLRGGGSDHRPVVATLRIGSDGVHRGTEQPA